MLDPEIYGPQESALKEEHIAGQLNGMTIQQVKSYTKFIRVLFSYLPYKDINFIVFIFEFRLWMKTSCLWWIIMTFTYRFLIGLMLLMAENHMLLVPYFS